MGFDMEAKMKMKNMKENSIKLLKPKPSNLIKSLNRTSFTVKFNLDNIS